MYFGCNLDIPIYVCRNNQFFRENVVVIAISELGPASNERYENSAFYGPFRFLIFILIFDEKTILYVSHFTEKIREMLYFY